MESIVEIFLECFGYLVPKYISPENLTNNFHLWVFIMEEFVFAAKIREYQVVLTNLKTALQRFKSNYNIQAGINLPINCKLFKKDDTKTATEESRVDPTFNIKETVKHSSESNINFLTKLKHLKVSAITSREYFASLSNG